jgi:hypothetical protein
MEIPHNVPLSVMKKGYEEKDTDYHCLFCDQMVEKGIVYPVEEQLFEAWRYMQHHIETAHTSPFHALLELGKDYTGLSEQQSRLLELIYKGYSDSDIQKELNIGSLSTIRNHRFNFRKKERQAQTLLTLFSFLDEPKETHTISKAKLPATQSDSKLARYFSEEDGRLKTFRMKEYEKEALLKEIASMFERGKTYSESMINTILEDIYHDYVLLRRELVDRGFVTRTNDGSAYTVIPAYAKEGTKMDYKKEMKAKAKELKTTCGVYKLTNTQNGKIFVASSPNLRSINGLKFQLNIDTYPNKELQQDWKTYGESSFTFEVLETADEKELNETNKKRILEKLKDKWLEELQPFGEKGYNREKRDR